MLSTCYSILEFCNNALPGQVIIGRCPWNNDFVLVEWSQLLKWQNCCKWHFSLHYNYSIWILDMYYAFVAMLNGRLFRTAERSERKINHVSSGSFMAVWKWIFRWTCCSKQRDLCWLYNGAWNGCLAFWFTFFVVKDVLYCAIVHWRVRYVNFVTVLSRSPLL